MAKKRIVVTGLGIVSCLGSLVDVFYDNLLAGKSGISLITKFPCDVYPTRFAGVIKDFSTENYIDKKQARRIDPYIAYAMVAGKKAVEDAGLTNETLDKLNKHRCGILMGSGIGGLSTIEDNVATLNEKGPHRVSPFLIPYMITNMGGALLAMDYGFMGPNYSISTACATSNNTIFSAAEHIRNGHADFMICGGSEAPITPIGISAFCACKALSTRNDSPTEASRPWDQNRAGFVMGEGAGALILESQEHALARGARIYAEYLGGGISCDAHHMTEPKPDGGGIIQCLQSAINDSGIKAEDINYVNAHATSTRAGDMIELNALKKCLPNPSNVVINATKSMIGHGLGAAGALEAIVVIKAIQTGFVHPTINLNNPEPDICFHVPVEAEKHRIRVAISNSFGFGGHNAAVVFAPYIQ